MNKLPEFVFQAADWTYIAFQLFQLFTRENNFFNYPTWSNLTHDLLQILAKPLKTTYTLQIWQTLKISLKQKITLATV